MRFPASCGGAVVSEQDPLKVIAGQVAQFLMEAEVVVTATAGTLEPVRFGIAAKAAGGG